MPVQHNYGAMATGGWLSAWSGHLPYFSETHGEPRWCYQRRSLKTIKDQNAWYSGWSYGCRIGDGGALDYCGTRNMQQTDLFEPYTCDGEGTSPNRFIRGTVVDASDVAVANATVQGFVTSTDAYIGQDVSRLDGTYTLGTDTIAGVQHYLVAYKAGSPDTAGTTVNTLTSTLVDGT